MRINLTLSAGRKCILRSRREKFLPQASADKNRDLSRPANRELKCYPGLLDISTSLAIAMARRTFRRVGQWTPCSTKLPTTRAKYRYSTRPLSGMLRLNWNSIREGFRRWIWSPSGQLGRGTVIGGVVAAP